MNSSITPKTIVSCRPCKVDIRVSFRELLEIGTPDCPNCGEEMSVTDKAHKNHYAKKPRLANS